MNEAEWGVEATFGNVAGDTSDPEAQFVTVITELTA